MLQKFLNKKYDFLKPIKTNNLIRVGSDMDGGYIVDSKIIKNFDVLISFGLGDGSSTKNLPWSFENQLIKNNENLLIHIYDYSVSKLTYYSVILKYFRRFITSYINLIKVLV